MSYLGPTATPWGHIALACAIVLQATQVSDDYIHEFLSRFLHLRLGLSPSSYFGGPWDSDFLP